MNVVVLGAGTVGRAIAELLCGRQVNVCVVDLDAEVLARVEERLDVRTVCGSACDAATLFQAGVQIADLILAVTSRDEVNLVSAGVAREMGAARCVARVFNPIFRDNSTFDYQSHFGIDRILSLEYLTALELAKQVRSSAVLAIENFVRGGIEVQGIIVGDGAKAVGVPLQKLQLPRSVRVGLISGSNRCIVPGGGDCVEAGDQVTLIGAHHDLEEVQTLFEQRSASRLRVLIAGGGEIGFNLARLLRRMRCSVTIMESDHQRCEFLADRLPDCTILYADVKSRADLEEARVGSADVFVACTGRDEENIVCGVEAKHLGCPRLLTIVRSPDYANVLERLGIDVAVSPRQAMARQIAGMVSRGPVLERSQVAGGAAEVWEVQVNPGVAATEAKLRDLQLPDSLVAAIERDDFVKVAGADDQLQAGDVAVLLVNKRSQDTILRLFEKSAG
ncbi:MAG: Trk system potassium transporter TrkA [Planctomycetaceae bacterium]|nr:Trk system potassium transporter TrkA [Planctomycetaceae bacterium]